MLVANEAWYERNPFLDVRIEGVSENLMMDPAGTTDGHNVAYDSTFMDSMPLDKDVPLSPLFVKDLAGRSIYVGYGPDRKYNIEWASYILGEEKLPENERNGYIPLCVFPRFCRDTSSMEGNELLEQVFLTKFRCLEMSMGFNGRVSGMAEEDDLVAATYLGANLYPYKLRLDTYYVDGFKLPQVNLLFARNEMEGINPAAARALGDEFMVKWGQRPAGTTYETWFAGLGEDEIERLYKGGCTVIPTFEACNGFHVVGRNFELEDYWPGRAVMGLHLVVESRSDKAPVGTILEVLEPGYVTGDKVKPAHVIVSDGTGYVSPNVNDPEALVPNLNLPHPRVSANWRATWLPTHPEHFEAPAMWGWDVVTGRFMQIAGPIWDPLHYYYESVDLVLKAFDAHPLRERRGLVPVPEHMEQRFFPVIPMKTFDTFSRAEYVRRRNKSVLPISCIKSVPFAADGAEYSCGLGYHPMPAEYEFELDVFWFPELHPLNRDLGTVPQDVEDRLAPVIAPQVTPDTFVASVDATEEATWLTDGSVVMDVRVDPFENYPQLMRYVSGEIGIDAVVRVCPVPYLGSLGDVLNRPATEWWLGDNGLKLDEPFAIEELVPGIADDLWDVRQKGVQLIQFRHLVYQENLPLYMLAWWYGWSVDQLQESMAEWLQSGGYETVEPIEPDAPAEGQ